MEGAIVIGDNLIDQEWFSQINVLGKWSDEDQLLNPQLEPAAAFDGGEETGIEIWANQLPPVGYNAIALLGTDIGLSGLISQYAITVEVLVDAAWVAYEDYAVYEIDSPGSPRSLVIVLAEYVTAGRYRVRWYAPGPGRVGHVICGRAIQKIDVADQGWAIRYHDQSQRDTTEGGQIYAEQPCIAREFVIQARTVSDATAFGTQRILETIALPSPSVTGGVSAVDGWLVCGDRAQGSAQWAGVFEVGKYYRVDFQQRQWLPSAADEPVFPRWSMTAANFSVGSQQGFPTGLASVYGEALHSTMQWACMTGDGQSSVQVLAVHEVDFEFAGWSYRAEQTSLQTLYARHGHSRPVIVLVRPSDPVVTRVTGIYGYLSNQNELRQVGDGDVFSTTLRITEAR